MDNDDSTSPKMIRSLALLFNQMERERERIH
jgi:hypothetical protein